MKNVICSVLISVGACVGLVSCSTTTTTVLHNHDGSYTIEASDRNESSALDGGIKKADELCGLQHKTAIIISHRSKYTGGMDQNAKGLLNVATTITSVSMGHQNNIAEQDTSKDYMVTIKFKCK